MEATVAAPTTCSVHVGPGRTCGVDIIRNDGEVQAVDKAPVTSFIETSSELGRR